MIRTTPFHPRLSELNTQGLYTHWQSHLSPLRYGQTAKHEYFAVRNAVGVFDTSPLFKYAVTGPDAERFLAGMLLRDVRRLRPGRAQYTLWCDDRGFVMEDGVVFRHSETDFLLTAARPNLGWLADHRGRLRVEIEDVSDDHGILAVQGPRSRAVLEQLTDEVAGLGYFDHVPAKVAGVSVTLSRTGYTGDLGYELTVPAGDAVTVLDAVLEAGRPHSLRPFGEQALMTLRIEAGLPLVDVEWHNSRLVMTDHDRVTPTELGMGWMVRPSIKDDRAFIGGAAIRREVAEGTSRWTTTGIVLDWAEWDALHRDAGVFPSKDDQPLPYESVLRVSTGSTDGGEQVGYCTSLVYSPVLQKHIGIARVRPDLGTPGTGLRLETTLHHRTTTVGATTTTMPFFNPDRKAAK